MNKKLISLLASCALLLTSCMTAGSGSTSSTTAQTSTTNNSVGTLANALLGATSSSSSSSTSGLSSLLGSVLGQFVNTTNANTIVGTWTYSQPSVQFESSNLLAQAGGSVVSSQVANKLSPYYQKLGLKEGVAQFVFNSDKTASLVLSNRTISGTYTLNTSAGTLTFSTSAGVSLFTAYVSVTGNQMSLTLDSSKLLSLVQSLGSGSGNSTASTISSLASSYSGMKTGFLFTR